MRYNEKGLAQWCVDIIIHIRAPVFPTLDNVNTVGCRRFESGTLFFFFFEIIKGGLLCQLARKGKLQKRQEENSE